MGSEMAQLIWTFHHPQMTMDHLGYIPGFLDDADPRGAVEQINTSYISGWSDFKGFKMLPNRDLKYPGDPPTRLLAEAKLRDETLLFYDSAWMAVVQPDGSFRVARLD